MRIKDYIKKYIAFLLCLAFLCAGLLFQCACVGIGKSLLDQNVAKSYGVDKDYSQVTLFTSNVAGFTQKNIPEVRNRVKTAISSSVVSDDLGGRAFIDAYSAIGKLDFTSQKSGGSIQVYAVSGDFFVFHPLTLVSGSYFSDENDENSDGVVLNELAAWQLFGAIDVVGMQIEVSDISMPVRGVVKDLDSKLSEASGENVPRVYMSFDKYLTANNSIDGNTNSTHVFCYETLIINPVKDFAINTLKDIVKLDDNTYEYVINSERFTIKNRLLLVKNFFNRVMNKTGVIYPYWENYARAKEQIIMLLTIVEILFFIASLVFLIIGLVKLKPEYIRLKAFLNNKKEDLSEYIKAKTRKLEEKKGEKGERN